MQGTLGLPQWQYIPGVTGDRGAVVYEGGRPKLPDVDPVPGSPYLQVEVDQRRGTGVPNGADQVARDQRGPGVETGRGGIEMAKNNYIFTE